MSWTRVTAGRRISQPPIPQLVPQQLVPPTPPPSPQVLQPQSFPTPPDKAVSNAVWGPALWTILHNAAEKIGSQQLKKLPTEETRIWFGLLQSLRYTLPCPQCKKHYSVYFGTTPIHRVEKEFIRTWLHNLHNQVNERNQKPAFPKEDLMKYDAIINVSEQIAIVHDHMLKAVRQGWSSLNDVQRTIRYVMEMKCFYDLI